jgi:GT2 family glycosyltransferase
LQKKINAMPKVYIIILNYKIWQDVIECLESVFRLKYDNFTVIVIDNDSKNGSIGHLIAWAERDAEVSQFPFSKGILQKPITYTHFHSRDIDTSINPVSFPGLVFIQNERNLGFAEGNNIALKLIMQEDAYVWLLNPDMVVQENTLYELIDCVSNRHSKVIAGAVLKSYDEPDKVLLYGGGKINFTTGTIDLIDQIGDIPSLDYISGGSMLTHTAHLRDIGLLPERYFLYWEETDWCYRARQKEYELHVCLSAICYDKISTNIGKSFLADFYYTRNGLMFIKTFRKHNIPVALFFAFLRLAKRVVFGKWDRAKGVYQGILAFLKEE